MLEYVGAAKTLKLAIIATEKYGLGLSIVASDSFSMTVILQVVYAVATPSSSRAIATLGDLRSALYRLCKHVCAFVAIEVQH